MHLNQRFRQQKILQFYIELLMIILMADALVWVCFLVFAFFFLCCYCEYIYPWAVEAHSAVQSEGSRVPEHISP